MFASLMQEGDIEGLHALPLRAACLRQSEANGEPSAWRYDVSSNEEWPHSREGTAGQTYEEKNSSFADAPRVAEHTVTAALAHRALAALFSGARGACCTMAA